MTALGAFLQQLKRQCTSNYKTTTKQQQKQQPHGQKGSISRNFFIASITKS